MRLRLALAIALLAVLPAVVFAQTTVTDTVQLPGGSTPAAGTLTVSWPGFTTAGSVVVPAGSQTVTLSAGGFSINLQPTVGASPAGTVYTAFFLVTNGTSPIQTDVEYWNVPASGPVGIAAIETTTSPINLISGSLVSLSGTLQPSQDYTVGTPGTYPKVTTDAHGRVTAGTTLSTGDIPNLPESQITSLVSDLGLKAPLASPALTGTPTVPTAAVDTSTTQAASTGFVIGQAASATPLMDGSAATGSSTRFARGDHVHPTDSTREATANKNVANGYAGLNSSGFVDTTRGGLGLNTSAQGQHLVGTGANPDAWSNLGLDVTQFMSGASGDLCKGINNACTNASFQGYLDISGFQGIQACNSDLFASCLKIAHIKACSTLTVVTSIPWYTPSKAGSIEGCDAGTIDQSGGFSLTASGPLTNGVTVGGVTATWTGSNTTFTNNYGAMTVPQLTSAGSTYSFAFTFPHSKLPAGTYYCLLCAHGHGAAAVKSGWNNDGDAQHFAHFKVDTGGNSNIIGLYDASSQERTELFDMRFGCCGSGTNSAEEMFDSAESTDADGSTRPIITNVNSAGEQTADCTSCYGLLFDGIRTHCVVSGGSPTVPATCYLKGGTGSIVGGAIQAGAALIGNPGSGYGSAPTITIYGNPTGAFGSAPNTSATAIAHLTGGVLTSIDSGGQNGTSQGAGYTNGNVQGGPVIDNYAFAGNAIGSGRPQNAVVIDGAVNPKAQNIHAINLLDNAVSMGEVGFVQGGVVSNVDNSTAGSVHLGYMIDGGQDLLSINGVGTFLTDDKFGFSATAANFSKGVAHYMPGSYIDLPIGFGVPCVSTLQSALAGLAGVSCDSATNRLKFNLNGGSSLFLPGLTALGTSGNAVKLAASGYDLTDAGAAPGLVNAGLNQFASTTSAQFFGVISDETGGSGHVVGDASPAITTPSITQVNDANGNAFLKSAATASAIDGLQITNAATANPATVTAVPFSTGSDANINLNLASKGTGTIGLVPATNATQAIKFFQSDGSTIVGSIDTTNKRLRIGDGNAPTQALDVAGAFKVAGTGLAVTYGGTSTVGDGLPSSQYATVSGTGSISLTAQTMVTAPATNPENCGGTTNASCYDVGFYLFQVGAGTSCASNTTIAVQVIFQDPSASGTSTVTVGDFVISGNGTANTPIPPNSSGSGATLVVSNAGHYTLRAKLSTAVQYQTTVTAGGSCSPAPTYWVLPWLKAI